MRLAAGVTALIAVVAVFPQAQPAPPRTPVIVELFTSEGCSSCPPADALLMKLEGEQPVAGAQVIALGQHVDYWDRLGWTDPFSSPTLTSRQSQYRRRLRLDQMFTPQVIVDGRDSIVGSDAGAVRKAIGKAARAAKAKVDLRVTIPSSVHISTQVAGLLRAGLKEPANLVLAITEDGLTSNVEEGENKGRRLSHAAVVRVISPVLEIPRGTDTTGVDVPVLLEATWNRERLNAVAFVQEQESGRILGAATAPIK
jgi:hypothetical protein